MSETRLVGDAVQREQALDISRSFIVQAPAGSGKTEILIQRYLALLASVDVPEEVIAITFTRKAAGEMRQRVLQALNLGYTDAAPGESHRLRTWKLGRAVRDRDIAMQWQLLMSPARLRIQTIDSLCTTLSRQMPMLAGYGGQFEATEHPAPLYLEAARRTLGLLNENRHWAGVVGTLLSHLDNDIHSAESLLVQMLSWRDQWLRHVADKRSPKLERGTLEQALANLLRDGLEEALSHLPREHTDELLALARFAAGNLEHDGKDSLIRSLADIASLPGSELKDLPRWLGVAELILTQEGKPRKRVDIGTGFPSPKEKARKILCDQWKVRMLAFLGRLEQQGRWVERLHRLRRLPPTRYSDAQWAVLGALVDLLPVAVAQLEVVFRERGQVDFSAIAQCAVRALGEEGMPTDLALSLDYRVRHLLVDEFQDTSLTQYELLEGLTRGWQPGDGRTLFVVGDPMQSIYRFREADVGLYLRARHRGIGTVSLQPLTLRLNFRSQAGLVAWCNECFRQVLPEEEYVGSGAVPFSDSEAIHPELSGSAVSVHPLGGSNPRAEARRVVQIIQTAIKEDALQKVAILVRSRNHLAAILPALRSADLPYQAIEIETLVDRPVVQDLHALTRAMLHPGDRISWLALLRAPWCGLTLADLEELAGRSASLGARTVFDLLQDSEVLERMSEDGRRRATEFAGKLVGRIDNRRRVSLRRWIEGAWLALGGPAALAQPSDLEDARAYFDLLEELSEGEDIQDFALLQHRAEALFARPDSTHAPNLQVMTIHRAKGLEFDTVILPGLGYKQAKDGQRLLRWIERPRAQDKPDLLLAPIRERREPEDAIYGSLAALDAERARHEEGRLLYVAATRAKARLHLVGHLAAKSTGELGELPDRGTSLERLWPVIGEYFRGISVGQEQGGQQDAKAIEQRLRRFPIEWCVPEPRPGVPKVEGMEVSRDLAVEFSWASEVARQVGVVVHRVFQLIAEDGIGNWHVNRAPELKGVILRSLRQIGLPELQLPTAVARSLEAVTKGLADSRCRWILSAHLEAQSELRLTGLRASEVHSVAIDRTFVDAQDVRWIIDFKTSAHEGANLAAFLDNERERYREQLEGYALLMRRCGELRPIRLALYFPLQQEWREWQASSGDLDLPPTGHPRGAEAGGTPLGNHDRGGGLSA